jgi:hypothetical protein
MQPSFRKVLGRIDVSSKMCMSSSSISHACARIHIKALIERAADCPTHHSFLAIICQTLDVDFFCELFVLQLFFLICFGKARVAECIVFACYAWRKDLLHFQRFRLPLQIGATRNMRIKNAILH